MKQYMINDYMDAIYLTDPKEKFEDLDMDSPKGIAVIFDAVQLNPKTAEILRVRLIKKLEAANSPRLNALDYASTYMEDGQAPLPVSLLVDQLRHTYNETLLRVKSELQAKQQAEQAANEHEE